MQTASSRPAHRVTQPSVSSSGVAVSRKQAVVAKHIEGPRQCHSHCLGHCHHLGQHHCDSPWCRCLGQLSAKNGWRMGWLELKAENQQSVLKFN